MAAMCVSVSLGFLPAFGFGTLRNGKAGGGGCYKSDKTFQCW